MTRETLHMYPSIKNDTVFHQLVSIAAVDFGVASVIMHKTYYEHPSQFVRIRFTREEVDRLVEALLETL